MEPWREEFYASDYGSKYLIHHGIKGQRWGIRRYQNEDGSLTAEGRKRYSGEQGEHNRMRDEGFQKVFDKRNSESRGKRFMKDLLLGPSASMTYDMARELEGNSRAKAWLKSLFDANYAEEVGEGVSRAIKGPKSKKPESEKSKSQKKRETAKNIVGDAVGFAVKRKISKNQFEQGHVTSGRQRQMIERYANAREEGYDSYAARRELEKKLKKGK